MELKEAGESLRLKAVHDLEAFGLSKNKDSNDLLLQIAAIEAEWNALTVVFFVQAGNRKNDEEDKKDRNSNVRKIATLQHKAKTFGLPSSFVIDNEKNDTSHLIPHATHVLD